MSFDTLKVQAGQQITQIADIQLDQCKYTTAALIADGVTLFSGIAQGATNQVAVTGGAATSFTNGDAYIKVDNEIMKITILSDSIVDVTDRGQFGTDDVTHQAVTATIMHSGEADGSCYGFPQTCSAPDTFLADTFQTFRFSSVALDWSDLTYPGFNGWTHSPPLINPGDSLGRMASISLSLKDGGDSDNYVPYPDRRTSNGTLFTKLIARNPYWEGRPVKIHMGFDPKNLDFDNFITREYIINSIQLKNGILSLSARDPLMLADEVKSKAPVLSPGGLAILVDDASTTITYNNDDAFAYGEDGVSSFVRIDSEVIAVTATATTNVLNIDTRGIGGTEQADHSVSSTIQACLVYTSVNVVTVIVELLTDYTNIPSRFFDDYSAVIAATSNILLTANINKPTSVRTLIDELIKTGDLIVYYDEQNQLIKIKQVSDPTIENVSLTQDDHILENTLVVTRKPKEQYTRFPVAWAPNDITKTTDEENFSIVLTSIEANNELPERIGEVNEKKIFYNRWLTGSAQDVTIGASISQFLLDRNADMPEDISFQLDVESVYTTQGALLDYGSIINVATDRRVEADGSPKARNYQVIRMQDLRNMKYAITAKLFQEPVPSNDIDFTISSNRTDYDLSLEYAPASPGQYTVVIPQGVTIGATRPGTPAFTTGTQVSGVTFIFVLLGFIEGKGGDGGAGADLEVFLSPTTASYIEDGVAGSVGGDAFNATVDCEIQTGTGLIWAGGGGGAGYESFATRTPSDVFTDARGGNGGGGGQGFAGGGGGDAGRVWYLNMGGQEDVQDTGTAGTGGSTGAQGWTGAVCPAPPNIGIGGGAHGLAGDGDPNGAAGGLSGFAIKSNGNTVTITSGDNSTNIRGRRS